MVIKCYVLYILSYPNLSIESADIGTDPMPLPPMFIIDSIIVIPGRGFSIDVIFGERDYWSFKFRYHNITKNESNSYVLSKKFKTNFKFFKNRNQNLKSNRILKLLLYLNSGK